jgi:hypothetical protein
MTAFVARIRGIVAAIVAAFRRKPKPIETICRELAEASTDPIERAALLEMAENYRREEGPPA